MSTRPFGHPKDDTCSRCGAPVTMITDFSGDEDRQVACEPTETIVLGVDGQPHAGHVAHECPREGASPSPRVTEPKRKGFLDYLRDKTEEDREP